jgi:GDPmannose 4,6-dehydratase
MKIINRAIEIKKNPNLNLIIGSLDHARDWSYAEDIVEAINKLVDLDLGSNYVLGSGKASSIKDIVEFIFQELNLNWEEHVQVDNELLRKGEPKSIVSVPSKILKEANWKTTTELNEILSKCIFYKQKIINL